MEKQVHTLDILFPLGLMAAFAAAVISVLLMTAGVYRGNVERSAGSFNGPTALAYVSEKLHQNDRAESVSVGRIEGCSALILTREHEGSYYDTYIYCYDGSLRELMVKRELEPQAAMGRELLQIESFTAEMAAEDLLVLRCEDESHTLRESYISLQGGEELPWN